tara:strand:- start:2147 stop:3211 length:1065 start_codon:yes stop_codon:yes gene_type:complete
MSDKISGIELNVEKNNRRVEISTQKIEWLRLTKTCNLLSASLPAENWYAENLMCNMIEMACLPHLKNVEFHGMERNRSVALSSLKTLPKNATIINNTLHYALTRKVTINKNIGVGYVDELAKCSDMPYNFIFADYCCPINGLLIKHSGEYMGRMTDGTFYITLGLHSRKAGGTKQICKLLRLSYNNIAESLPKRLIGNAKRNGSRARLIYRVLYNGGKRGSTSMITLGFMIGNGDISKIGIIDKDIRINKSKVKRGIIYNNFKKNPELFDVDPVKLAEYNKELGALNKRLGKLKKQKVKTTLSQRNDVRELLERGLSNEVISLELGISRGSVGAISAVWKHPDKFNGRPKKLKH